MTIEAAATATKGTLVQRGAASFCGVTIDSRQVQSRQAFVAIAGDRFDGHDYWRQAVQAGAVVLVVARPVDGPVPAGISVIHVAETRKALADLGRAWRWEVAPAVVAITGSVGKTTTKELCRNVLAQAGPTHSTPGNFNNDIGLPLTLLSMDASTRYLVVEMGMNAPGEIASLTQLTEPCVGVITCVAPVHLEGLGSLEAIAQAKGELLMGLGPESWAVVPGDEPLLEPYLTHIALQRQIRFGTQKTDDVCLVDVQNRGVEGSNVRLSLRGQEVVIHQPLPGEHNARNTAAAAAVGMVLGVSLSDIVIALSTAPSMAHRSAIRRLGCWWIFDDCYNANPLAMKAALDTLAQCAKGEETIAALGGMLELGPQAERFHFEVGAHAAQKGLSYLITVGPLAIPIAEGARAAGMDPNRIVHVNQPEEAAQAIKDRAAPKTWILVKASRGMRLERIIDVLQLHS